MKELESMGRSLKEGLLYGVLALVLGAIIGVIDTVFGRGLIAISAFRDSHVFPLLLFLAPAGLLIVWAYSEYGKNSGKGMGLILTVGQGVEEEIPLRLAPFVLLSTWITHLFGGSAGREGVAVQIGATFSHWAAKKIVPDAGKIFLVAGMAAGFSGLFRTPIAATFFAVEVIYSGKLNYRALFPSFLAAFSAAKVSALLGLSKFTAEVGEGLNLTPELFIKVMVLGLIFGLTGKLFVLLLSNGKRIFAEKFKNPYMRIGIIGVCLTVVLFAIHQGRYCGLGTNLISNSFTGGEIYAYDWILKILLTVVTLAAGYQGGEVTPLFSIGASLGVAIAGIFGLPAELVAALGYATVFGSASNTYLAPVLIGAEVFGFEHLPLFFIACTVAHCLGGNGSIYSAQKVVED